MKYFKSIKALEWKQWIAAIIGFSMVASCGSDFKSPTEKQENSTVQELNSSASSGLLANRNSRVLGQQMRGAESAGSNTSSTSNIEKSGYAIIAGEVRAVTVIEIDGVNIFEGDIAVGPLYQQFFQLSGGRTGNVWADKIVRYRLDSSLMNPARVRAAIAHWEQKTAFRFVELAQGAYLNFSNNSTGCSSFVGRQGGAQRVQIGNCSFGSVVHEIGHALGLVHEQSRRDRDNFVEILWNNVEDGRERNFRKSNSNQTLGRYDFGSIMHYGRFAFSKNGLPTIRAKRGSPAMGQRSGLSVLDVAGIRDLYSQYAKKGVKLFLHSNFRGASQLFGPGLYTASFQTLGSVGNDSVSSIKVPFGYEARICTDSYHGYGFGECKTYSFGGAKFVGNSMNDKLSYIRVLPTVTGFRNANYGGKKQPFSAGRTYKANKGELGGVNNDRLTSMKIPRGMKVKICQHETGGICQVLTRNTPALSSRINELASYIKVYPVIQAFLHSEFRGTSQVFAEGSYRSNNGTFYKLRNDSLSSIIVPNGLKAKICAEANGRGLCKTFSAGHHRFVGREMNDKASFIRVFVDRRLIAPRPGPIAIR